jgi:hypothetical protein
MSLADTMKAAVKAVLIVCGVFILFVLIFVASFNLFVPTTRLQKLNSPDRKHHAELIRTDGIDRNYTIRVDGTTVYRSPDFAPRSDIPYRATLVWDAAGRIIIFEVARHRVFGFNTTPRQRLSDAQLLAVELPPDPPL